MKIDESARPDEDRGDVVDPVVAVAPPTRMRRPRRDEVRRRLLAAALELFTEHGYDRTTLEQVTLAAGLSKGAVYSNFASKDELFLALLDKQIESIIARTQGAVKVPHDRAQTAQLIGRRLTEAFIEDRDWQLLFLDYVVRAARDPKVGERFALHRRRIRRIIADAGRDIFGDVAGLDPDALATAAIALSNGLAIERLTDPAAVPDDLFGRILHQLRSARE
ncbi:TetR/AcrR family transcriptional regulator [Nocardia sp. NPDC051570]|uniref:TetR/AcrR family transcriptional regulator n=1 Tax=Nocardia sp. NPDC051570 TaxID=3364324 RepID=UPI00378ECFFF